MGVSQGGLMARSILEDCTINPQLKYRNLLTIGTPNMGISEVPKLGCNTKVVSDEMAAICALEHGFIVSFPYSTVA